MQQNSGQPRRDNSAKPLSPYAMLGLGFEIAIPTLILLFVGHKLDQWWGSTPWMLVLGAMLGMVIGFYNLVRRALPKRDDRAAP